MVLFPVMSACSPTVSRQEYVPYVEAQMQELTQRKEIGDFIFEVTALPTAYTVLKHQPIHSQAQYLEAMKDAEKFCYVAFKIDTKDRKPVMENGIEDQTAYDKRVNYFAFAMQHDLRLIAGKDTLPCEIHHFEQFFTVAPHIIIMAAFAKPQSHDVDLEAVIFQYRDRELGMGMINMPLALQKASKFPVPAWN